jgi:hypothetical protein
MEDSDAPSAPTRVTLAADSRPPPEPPPSELPQVGFQFDEAIDAIPPEYMDAFVDQYLRDEATMTSCRLTMNDVNQNSTVTCLTIPQHRIGTPPPPARRELVTYYIPMDKAQARTSKDPPYPTGSMMDPGIFIRP